MLDLVLAHALQVTPPPHNAIYILSARAAIAGQQYQVAEDRLKEAGDCLESDVWRGHILYARGQYGDCIEHFEGLLENIIRKLIHNVS